MALVYRGHSGLPVHAVRWSPDGTRIASASRKRGASRYGDFCDVDEWIEWWLRLEERPRRTEEDWRDVTLQILEEGVKGNAHIWEAETGATLLVYRDHPHGVNDVAWSPEGTRIVSAGGWDGTARIWNATSGESLLMLQDEAMKGWGEQISRAMDEASSWQRRFSLLNTLWAGWSVGHAGWSSDGARAFSTQSRLAYVWDAATGRRLITYGCHRSDIQAMAVAPDGARAVSGSNWIAQVWDAIVKGRALLIYRGHAGDGSDIVSLAWSPDSQRIASGTSVGMAHVWDTASGETLLTYRGHAPSGEPPITRFANAQIQEVVRRRSAALHAGLRLSNIQAAGRTYGVYALAWSPDGRHIASGGWDRLVRIWDAQTGQQLTTYGGHSALVTALDWAPDGGRIASGDLDGTVHVWPVEDAATGEGSR